MEQDGTPIEDDAGRPEGGCLLEAVCRTLVRETSLVPLVSLDFAKARTDRDLLALVLSNVVGTGSARETVFEIARAVLETDRAATRSALVDINVTTRKSMDSGGDAATVLFSRGFHAVLGHRIAHHLWHDGRQDLARGLAMLFGRALSTDIHPAAKFGAGIWVDHGLGLVVGETSVIEDDVSIWHGVTLGSSLKEFSDHRHPRLRRGATIGASATILGDIDIGAGSVVAAGSVVLKNVEPGTTVAGVPARVKLRRASSFSGFRTAFEENRL